MTGGNNDDDNTTIFNGAKTCQRVDAAYMHCGLWVCLFGQHNTTNSPTTTGGKTTHTKQHTMDGWMELWRTNENGFTTYVCTCDNHCVDPDPNAQPNKEPILGNAPQFVRRVANGALFQVSNANQDTVIPVVHLWGTPYQKGFAHGTLMKDKMSKFIAAVWVYLEDQVEAALNGSGIVIPLKTAKWIADVGLDVALDLESDATAPYTGAYFFDEIRGMSDATGVSYDTIRRVHMLGELTKGGCSMIGAWGDALANKDGLFTMRALDWNMAAAFRNHAELTVYHAQPNSTEKTFLNIGWTGWLGSVGGVNAEAVSAHEIGASFPDPTFGNESRFGIPFTYLLRDVLQFDATRLDGLSRMASAHRTCDLILGVGGGKERRFNSVEYSYSTCDIMDDTNQRPLTLEHPRIPSMVYHAMDWNCPGYAKVMAAQLRKYHGSFTALAAVRDVMPIVQTGDLHVWVADLVNMTLHVSFAASDNAAGPMKAYDRPYFFLNLTALFTTPEKLDLVELQ
jgi:hypothetical protein